MTGAIAHNRLTSRYLPRRVCYSRGSIGRFTYINRPNMLSEVAGVLVFLTGADLKTKKYSCHVTLFNFICTVITRTREFK